MGEGETRDINFGSKRYDPLVPVKASPKEGIRAVWDLHARLPRKKKHNRVRRRKRKRGCGGGAPRSKKELERRGGSRTIK